MKFLALSLLFCLCLAPCYGNPTSWEIDPCSCQTKGCPINIRLEDAIATTLNQQWQIELSRASVQGQYGVLQETSGAFDSTVLSNYEYTWRNDIQLSGFKTNIDGYDATLDLSLSHLNRIGTLTSLGMTVDKSNNPIFPSFFNPSNEGTLFFAIDQPLLRRFLYSQETANERSACLQLKASKWDLIQTVAVQVRTVINRYWNLVASIKLLDIREKSQKRLEEIAQAAERLVEGDQLAATELNQQYAQLSQEKRIRTAAEQRVYASYNELLLSMGIETEESPCFRRFLPKDLSLEEFPLLIEEEIQLDPLIALATENRADYLAAIWRTKSAGVQLRAAENALLPEVNLRFEANLINREVGREAKRFFAGVSRSHREKDWTAGVVVTMPLWNCEAKGRRRQRQSERQQSYISQNELIETIKSDLSTVIRNHYSLLEELKHANETVKWYEAALWGELRRLKEGYSTLFVVLDFEMRLSNAQADQTQIYNEYAQNLADLLFLSGLLVQPDCNLCQVNVADVRSFETLIQSMEIWQ